MMMKTAATAFLFALAAVAVGCGGSTPESVCSKLKDLGSEPGGCVQTWTARKAADEAGFKADAACVMAAKSGGDAAKCSAPKTATP